jgi:LysM repeat protein
VRPDVRPLDRFARPSALTALPAALAGSLALLVGATPAQAVEPSGSADAGPRPLFTALDRAVVKAAALRAAAEAGPPSYTVQAGDTVSAIAARHGLRTVDVLAINGLSWSSVIQPGQILLLAAASAPEPVSPPVPTAPVTGGYTVVGGDTISAIAQRHGVSVDALFAANGLGWSSIIFPGQTLAIPGTDVQLVASITPPESVGSTELDGEQIANAQVIIRIGRELGVPDRGIAIALGTAMQESWLRNLDWGDRDSLGLFQQRPSTGWGTAEQVSDPDRSARLFYGGPSDPNGHLTAGLLDIVGWEAMAFADAAQAVQISAHPERYAQWEQPAYAWLAAHG